MARVGVVTFPGSNCDADMRDAIDRTDGLTAVALWHKDASLQEVDAVVLPGGFSYGDYLRCGAMARLSPVMREVVAFAHRGGPVLGVCNGFQILCEAGLLPGALVRNRHLRFVCDRVYISVERDTPFTRAGTGALQLPVAHGEGCWVADDDTLARAEDAGQLLFHYVSAAGQPDPSANPNGSLRDVAGVCSARGNVVGLMPHPERAVRDALGGCDGQTFFDRLAGSLA